jgi:hypothetical protein
MRVKRACRTVPRGCARPRRQLTLRPRHRARTARRHKQCDLATTTDILLTPLAAKCRTPFTPATAAAPAHAECCTSDLTLAEFRTLCGRMDSRDERAADAEAWVHGSLGYRSDALGGACGTLVSHAEYIELVTGLGAKHIPEVKEALVSELLREDTAAACARVQRSNTDTL